VSHTDDTRFIIYYRNVFIIQATGLLFCIGHVCNDCSFMTADVATAELGHPVENVFGMDVRHLAIAYLKMMQEFNPTNKTLVRRLHLS
jgi:hypothetical protein